MNEPIGAKRTELPDGFAQRGYVIKLADRREHDRKRKAERRRFKKMCGPVRLISEEGTRPD